MRAIIAQPSTSCGSSADRLAERRLRRGEVAHPSAAPAICMWVSGKSAATRAPPHSPVAACSAAASPPPSPGRIGAEHRLGRGDPHRAQRIAERRRQPRQPLRRRRRRAAAPPPRRAPADRDRRGAAPPGRRSPGSVTGVSRSSARRPHDPGEIGPPGETDQRLRLRRRILPRRREGRGEIRPAVRARGKPPGELRRRPGRVAVGVAVGAGVRRAGRRVEIRPRHPEAVVAPRSTPM